MSNVIPKKLIKNVAGLLILESRIFGHAGRAFHVYDAAGCEKLHTVEGHNGVVLAHRLINRRP